MQIIFKTTQAENVTGWFITNQSKLEQILSPHFPKNSFTIKLLPVFDMNMKQNYTFIEYSNTLPLKLLFFDASACDLWFYNIHY